MLSRNRLLLLVLATALVGALLVPAAGSAHAPDAAPRRAADQAPERTAQAVLAQMSLPQRVGQLFMVGTPADAVDPATQAQIGRLHVGNVMLTGRSYGGVRPPARVSRAMRAEVGPRSTAGVELFVATDQEGGQVRVLQGPGFSDIPSALEQGTWEPRRLRGAAKVWAGQLRRAGVNLDLAPVMDTVPSKRFAQHNPPIGRYDRQFGYTTKVVARHGVAFLRGLADGDVVPTVKHFPGLGRVRGNTDTRTGVTDRVTTRHDAYLAPFRAAIEAGAPVVMMSTASYERLDPDHPAAFSPFVIGTMLRGDLGFDGVVISGDLLLSVDPDPVPAMYAAVLRRARTNDAFRAKVDAAALRVLRAKQGRGLL